MRDIFTFKDSFNVTLTTASGRQVQRDSRGAFPDMTPPTPEPEPEEPGEEPGEEVGE